MRLRTKSRRRAACLDLSKPAPCGESTRVTTSDNEWQCGWEILFRILMFNKGIWMIWFKPAGILCYKSCVKSLILQVLCQSLQVWRKNEESRRRSKNVEQRLKRKGGQLTMLPLCAFKHNAVNPPICRFQYWGDWKKSGNALSKKSSKMSGASHGTCWNKLFVSCGYAAMPGESRCIQDIYLKT